MLSLIKIKDIHQREDTDRVYAIIRTGPRATHMVRTGHLAPAGTMLVTPGVEGLIVVFNHNVINLYFTANKSTMHTSYYDNVATSSVVLR